MPTDASSQRASSGSEAERAYRFLDGMFLREAAPQRSQIARLEWSAVMLEYNLPLLMTQANRYS